jgi:Sap, sulfolipid-1-addressing protein
MWITLFMIALAVSLEPFRIGMTVLVLRRPKPLLQLLSFLCGGFTMGMTVGLIVLFIFRQSPAESNHLTLPQVQILMGGTALLVAAVLAIKPTANHGSQRPVEPNEIDRQVSFPRLSMRARKLLNGHSLWVAAVTGLGIALPSVDYLAALAIILSSGTTVAVQISALLMFNIVAFITIEIPLIAYLLAPGSTLISIAALNNWIRSRRRPEVAALLAAVGCVLLVVGIVSL